MALMDALPAERMPDSIPLTSAAATLAFISGDVRRGAGWLDALGDVQVDELEPRVQAIYTLACLLRRRLDGECAPAAELAEELLELAEAGFLPLRTAERVKALALGLLGVCETWLRREAAEAHLHEALHLARAGGVAHMEIASLGSLAMLELWQGRLRRAERLARRAVDAAESGGLDRTAQAALGYAVLAFVEYEWDDLEGAESKARSLAALARTSGDRIARALSAYVDGCLCLTRGDVELGIQRLKGVAIGERSTRRCCGRPARASTPACSSPPATRPERRGFSPRWTPSLQVRPG